MIKSSIIKTLRAGGIGVWPTDTLYGLIGSALKPETVKRIYRVRRRPANKPLIILISDISELKTFGIKVTKSLCDKLEEFWPGPFSIILPCRQKKFAYLHRGRQSLAFRLPAKKELINLLQKTGPLVAPSANLSGRPPAQTIAEARSYFGQQVDFYLTGGRLKGPASTLLRFK